MNRFSKSQPNSPFKMHPGMPTIVPHKQQPLNKSTSTGGCGCGKQYKMLGKNK